MKKYIYLLLLLVPTFSFAQQITVSGTVVDAAGESLIGATVMEKGTNNGTVSDYNGNYELTVSEGATLMITYTGFGDIDMAVDGQRRINITLIESSETLEEVVVRGFAGVVGRARKRVASIQTIPESVTAINSEDIEKNGVSNITDFAQLVPNLKLSESQAVGTNFLVVRGIPQIRNTDAPVAFVIDGVTIPDPSLLNQELFDLALIEAVKGPQGALYGKNAIGGAINIYSKEPTNTQKNNVKIGFGNGGHYLGQLVSSGALKEDKVFYRISGQYQNFDGLLTNEFLDKKVDFSQDLTLRGQLIANLSDNFKATYTLQYMNTDAGATYYSVHPTWADLSFTDFLLPNPEDDANVISQDVPGTSNLKNLFTNLKLDYNFGKVKLQSITAYSKVDRNTFGDSFNQEIRLTNTATNSKVNWSLGGFVQNIERDFFQSDFTLSDEFSVTDYTVTFNTVALFGFLDYKVTDKFTASVGLRFDADNYDQDDRLGGVVNERSQSELQPKVSLSYQASEDALIYANYGRGYRSGGFNPVVTDFYNQDFEGELSDNFELGLKTSSWNDRFIFNASVFYSDYTNRQQFALEPEFFIPGNYNYDKSTIFGVEFDTKTRVSKYLDVLFNFGFVDSKITEGGSTGGANGQATDLNAFNDNITSFVPRTNFNLGLASSIPLSDKATLDLNVNLNNTGKIYWTDDNVEDFIGDAYNLLDARASLSINKMTFSLWGRNITGTKYYLEYDAFGIGWRGRPATVGATIGLDF